MSSGKAPTRIVRSLMCLSTERPIIEGEEGQNRWQPTYRLTPTCPQNVLYRDPVEYKGRRRGDF